MKKLLQLTLFSILSFFIVSCYYDNEEALYPNLNSSCDTTNVTFSGTVTIILKDNCYSCHSNATAASSGGNIRLQDYADVVSQSVSVVNAIKHTGSVSPMPKNGGKISDCAIKQFDIWIAKGMQDN